LVTKDVPLLSYLTKSSLHMQTMHMFIFEQLFGYTLVSLKSILYVHTNKLKIQSTLVFFLFWWVVYDLVDLSDLELKPVGTLEVKLVRAKDLTNKDVIGKSDPFAVLFIRPLHDRTKTSKTIVRQPLFFLNLFFSSSCC